MAGLFASPSDTDPRRIAAALALAGRLKTQIPTNPSASPQPSADRPTGGFDYGALLNSPFLSSMSEEDMNKLADQRAAAAIQSQSDPVRRAMAEASARALGAEQAKVGFTNAAQQALGGVAPQLAGAYQQAQQSVAGTANDVSAEAKPFAGFDAQAIGQTGDAANSWAGLLGQIQGTQGQEDLGHLIASGEQQQADYEQQLIDIAKTQPEMRQQALDALYSHEMDKLNARLGIAQQQQSVLDSNRQYGLNVKQLNAQIAQNKLTASEGIREFNMNYAQQAKQFGLQFGEGQRQFNVSQALQNKQLDQSQTQFLQQMQEQKVEFFKNLALQTGNQDLQKQVAEWQHAIDTGNLKVQQDAEQRLEDELGHQKAQDAFNNKLATNADQRAQAGLDLQKDQFIFDKKVEADKAAIALAQAQAQGIGIDVGASRTSHIFILDNGQVMKDKQGNPIPVPKQSWYGADSTTTNPKKLFSSAVGEARTIRGNPVTYDSPNTTVVSPTGKIYEVKGKYVAAPGTKGVFTVPNYVLQDGKMVQQGWIKTTNDPSKAKYDSDYTFAKAIIYLTNKYPGLTNTQARTALIRAGWRPDGQRP